MRDILDIAQQYVKHYSVAQKYAIKGCIYSEFNHWGGAEANEQINVKLQGLEINLEGLCTVFLDPLNLKSWSGFEKWLLISF